MISAGCDVGALATKTVVIKNGRIVGWDITPNEGRMIQAVEESLARSLGQAGLVAAGNGRLYGTGWGKRYISQPFQDQSLINCLARGAFWLRPSVRTVVDIGGLSTTVIHLDDGGRVIEYRNNDRCASGTGFFIELAAQALEINLDEMESMARKAERRAHIGAQCAVFGESEIVSHINEGVEPADIIAGLAYSVGMGAATIARRLGAVGEVMVTGGVVKFGSVVSALEEKLEVRAFRPEVDPQIVAALGAALAVNGR